MIDTENEITELTSEPMSGKPVEVRIVKLEPTTAGEVYGDKTIVREGQSLEQAKGRRMARIFFEGEGVTGRASMNWPEHYHPKSDLGRFVRRYGSLPKVGLAVFAALNAETGFYDLDLGK